ncbi:MAG TPA: hypothetical protein VGF14_07170 [Alphaproteobacteria bacterium]
MRKTCSLVLFLSCFSLTACQYIPDGFGKKDPRSNLFAKEDPHFNTTRASDVLACIGHQIDNSPLPGIDLIVSGVRDQTKPIEVPGLLATDNTMMATVAVDRLNTDKVSVIGSNGMINGRPAYQLVGAFTELNRTYNSTALGGAARIGNIELDLGNDREWNHVALDLGLTHNSRLVNGMTVSVNISLQNNNVDGNMTVTPGSSNSAVIAVGFRTKEGIHAAQRLLIETAIGVMMAKLYEVDASPCFKRVYQEQADFKEESIPDFYRNKSPIPNSTGYNAPVEQSNIGEMPAPAPANENRAAYAPAASQSADDTTPIGSNCRVMMGSTTAPSNWRYEWNGACDGSNLAEGEGTLRVFVNNQLQYRYIGNMQGGQRHGNGRMEYAQKNQIYNGSFERDNPTGDGTIVTPHGTYRAQYSSETRTLTTGEMIR